MNLNAGATFTVPSGYPIRLLPAWDTMLSGVIPKSVAAVSATLQTESGTARAHLAIYTMPTTVNGSDQALVAQTDLAGLTSVAQTMTVTIPTTVAPACYIVRLWVDSITGSAADTVSRDGVTAVANEPKIPVAVKVTAVTVS